MNSNIYIVGSGIIGLSVAEYFSRNNPHVTVISNNNPLAGSYAAAANLATKGQLFGRDPHFQIKLDAKKIYPTWIQNLLAESSITITRDVIFKIGQGIDVFYNQTDRDKHLKRVIQDITTDSILPHKENSIIYSDEAWVDAQMLLNLLTNVLKKRNVNFIHQHFSKKKLHEILAQKMSNVLIFCAGAWTKQLLVELELPLPNGFNKSERLTLGSTFQSSRIIENNNFILYEKISEGLKYKVTFSGNKPNQTISASSMRIQNLNSPYQADLKIKNEMLLKLASNNASLEEDLVEKTGLRVGYSHSEILIEPVNLTSKNSKAIVCCGAHKSGFLFAPLLGQKIEVFI